MAKKDYAAEMAELRAQLEAAEQEAETMKEKAETYMACRNEIADKKERLQHELDVARDEIMRVKAHAYDLMIELEKAETA